MLLSQMNWEVALLLYFFGGVCLELVFSLLICFVEVTRKPSGPRVVFLETLGTTSSGPGLCPTNFGARPPAGTLSELSDNGEWHPELTSLLVTPCLYPGSQTIRSHMLAVPQGCPSGWQKVGHAGPGCSSFSHSIFPLGQTDAL